MSLGTTERLVVKKTSEILKRPSRPQRHKDINIGASDVIITRVYVDDILTGHCYWGHFIPVNVTI